MEKQQPARIGNGLTFAPYTAVIGGENIAFPSRNDLNF
jgi:hypothetical protein